jgi:hypothetical protein
MNERLEMRVDVEFIDAVRELRRLYEDLPSKSEAIRRAVLAQLDTMRRERKIK